MSEAPVMVQLIERKKNGDALTATELDWLCRGYVAGDIPDYQVAAWLMAVRWRGMGEEETLATHPQLVDMFVATANDELAASGTTAYPSPCRREAGSAGRGERERHPIAPVDGMLPPGAHMRALASHPHHHRARHRDELAQPEEAEVAVLEGEELKLLNERGEFLSADDGQAVIDRAESVAEKPMFRDLLRERRCAVPIDGYYEWRTTSSGKAPFWFHLKSGEPFFLAGLWDRWHEGRPDELASYILMTTQPNALAAKVHDRMPVMLHARDVPRWLDPAIREPAQVLDLLGPYPADEMASRPVSRLVSNPDNEGPGLIEPEKGGQIDIF